MYYKENKGRIRGEEIRVGIGGGAILGRVVRGGCFDKVTVG
jgi:hypothetical protein